MEISRLFGKPKTYKIGGEDFTFKPLELDNIDILIGMEDQTKKAEAIKTLIITTFKKSYPDVKEEDIKKISLEYFEELTKAILDVHNLKT